MIRRDGDGVMIDEREIPIDDVDDPSWIEYNHKPKEGAALEQARGYLQRMQRKRYRGRPFTPRPK